MPHSHRLSLFVRVGGQQMLRRLLRSSISRVVHVVERAEIGAERAAGELRLATTLFRDRHMMVSHAQHGLPRLIIQKEPVSLLGHVPGGLSVANKNEERRALCSHLITWDVDRIQSRPAGTVLCAIA